MSACWFRSSLPRQRLHRGQRPTRRPCRRKRCCSVSAGPASFGSHDVRRPLPLLCQRARLVTPFSSGAGAAERPLLRTAESLSVLGGRPGLLFSSAAFDATNGCRRRSPGRRTGRPSAITTGLRCERVHFAAGAGICLAAERGMLTRYSAQTFGPDFHVRHTIPLQGVPSRARVSPDGRRGAVTVFVSGDSYSSTSFSTRTTLLDMSTGEAIRGSRGVHRLPAMARRSKPSISTSGA